MPTQTKVKTAKFDATKYHGLDRDALIRIYRTMFLSRQLDDREIQLKRQNKIFFQISGAGHEGVLVAAGLLLKPGYDWFFPYYRDRALCLTLGVTPYEMLLQALARRTIPRRAAARCLRTGAIQKLNIVTRLFAHRHAMAARRGRGGSVALLRGISRRRSNRRSKRRWAIAVRFHRDEIVYVSGGEGATSEGEFFEALNAACLRRLPVLFLVEDNGYAISVPVEVQTAGGSISKLVANFPHLHIEECDGTDPLESYEALSRAVAHCRARKGPALVHAHVTRPYSHSLSDDEKLYKTARGARRRSAARSDSEIRAVSGARRHSRRSANWKRSKRKSTAKSSKPPTARSLPSCRQQNSIYAFVYSPDVDPTAASNSKRSPNCKASRRRWSKSISATLLDEMARDERIVVFGEDVADCSREENLDKREREGRRIQGHGRIAAAIRQPTRVFNSPLAEANIVGRAIGMAMRGLKPVTEIQFFDYIWPAMMQLRNELATMRWRSAGNFKAPGGHPRGDRRLSDRRRDLSQPVRRSDFHAHSRPARGDAFDGARCLRPAAHRDPLAMIRCCSSSTNISTASRTIARRIPARISRFRLARRAWCAKARTSASSPTARWCIAPKWRRPSSSAKASPSKIIDLRTLSPYDWEAIAASVRKTNRVIVAYEDTRSWGYGAEIAARIADELFDDLDAPVRRVAAKDTFCAYHPKLEDAILPQTEDIVRAVRELAKY